MEDLITLTTIEQIKMISDPYKNKILNCFYQMGKPSTVKQVADKLGEVPSKVHYHVKKFESVGILKLIYTKEINGIVAKFYEPCAKSFNIDNEDYNDTISPVFKNNIEKMIHNYYSESEKIVLECFKNEDDIKNKKVFASVSPTYLYLTKEEEKEIFEFIKNFYDQHSVEKEGEGILKYHGFNVLAKLPR